MTERGKFFGKQVCEALGISPDQVTHIDIDIDAEGPLTVTVTFFSSLSRTFLVAALAAHVERVKLAQPNGENVTVTWGDDGETPLLEAEIPEALETVDALTL